MQTKEDTSHNLTEGVGEKSSFYLKEARGPTVSLREPDFS